MRVALTDKGRGITKVGRGELRWNLNWMHFLKRESDIRVTHAFPGLSYKCDIHLDANDTCESYDPRYPHVHFKFAHGILEMKDFACYKEGRLVVAHAYRANYEAGKKFWADDPKVKVIFLPNGYSDDLIPANASIPGFERRELTWVNKDPFNSIIVQRQPYVSENALYALRAIHSLSKKADFTFNVIVSQDLYGAHEDYREEVMAIVNDMPDKLWKRSVPWLEVVEDMGRSKLTVCPGTIAGSVLESILCKGVPVQQERAFLEPPREITLLPISQETTPENWVDVLETFWFDETYYQRTWEWYQDVFSDHRSDGMRRNWKESMETLGL